MSVANYTEMCLFTTSFVTADGEACSPGEAGVKGGKKARFVEVRYALEHVFNKPEEGLREVGGVLRVELEPDTSLLEECRVNMHYSPVVGWDMGGEMGGWFSERLGCEFVLFLNCLWVLGVALLGVCSCWVGLLTGAADEAKLLWVGGRRRKVLGNMPPNIAGGQKERGTRGEGLENVADEEKENAGGNGWLDWGKAAVSNVLGGNKEYEGINEGIGFSDVAPYLVISTKSWEDASRRLPDGEEMDITKFRPNIVIEGAGEEYEEDYWAELEIGNRQEGRVAKFVLTNNCARCNSLNVDFKTGKVGEGESGKILKKLNSNRRVDQGAKWSPVFGRYGFLARVDGGSGVEIKVGDEVRVLSRNDKHTRFGKWVAVMCVPRLTYHRMATTQYGQVKSTLRSTA